MAALVGVVVNVLFCILAIDTYGFSVLALGAALAMSVQCCILCVLSCRYLELEWKFFLRPALFKVVLAALVMLLVLFQMQQINFAPLGLVAFDKWEQDTHILVKITSYFLWGGAGLGSYGVMLLITGDLKRVIGVFKR